MRRSVSALVLLAFFLLDRVAFGLPVGPVIAETGFNDATGINSTPTPDSPYTLGDTIRDRGEGESGWSNLWTLSAGGGLGGSPSRAVANTVLPLEGDASLFIKENDPQQPTWIHRSLAESQYWPFIIEQHVRLPAGGGVTSRPGQGGTGSLIGPQWSASGGTFWAFDGNGAGGGVFEDTGIPWTNMEWHKVTLHVNPITQTFDFFVDNQKYEAPDPLGFRGTIPSVFFIEYLTSQAVWIDQLSIREIPEPSSFALAALGLLSLGCVDWRGRRRR